jgi:hypothetical protein
LVFGSKKGTLKQVLARYRKEVGEKLAARTLKLHRELQQQ